MIAPLPASTTRARIGLPNWRRALIATGILAVAAWLLSAINALPAPAAARYPTDADAALYAVDGWSVGPASVQERANTYFVTRAYRATDGRASAQLTLTTSPLAKEVLRAGADVPFLGSGFTVEPAPLALGPGLGGAQAQVARRSGETWLQVAVFGERRGLVGNGALGWGLAVFDTLLGRPNDYYLLRVVVPQGDQPAAGQTAVQLAQTLFPRLVAWYAHGGA